MENNLSSAVSRIIDIEESFKNKSVLLVQTSSCNTANALWPPVGLMYLGATLEKKGHCVQILDREALFLQNKDKAYMVDEITRNCIRDVKPDYIGISAFTPLIADGFHVARLAKRIYPDIPVILGGPHATADVVQPLMSSPFIDVTVDGEGEETLSEIVKGISWEAIKGIAFRKEGKIYLNHPREALKEIDSLPVPARHLVDMGMYCRHSYQVIRGLFLRTTSMMTSRGCPYKCKYCAGGMPFKNKLNFHSIDYVISELKGILSSYGVEGIYFLDDMFASNKKRMLEICNRFIDERLHKEFVWCAQMHVNSSDETLLRRMKEAGCVQVEYGFESNSQRILDLMHKKTTVGQNLKAYEISKRVGVRILANMMTNFPTETVPEMLESIKFARKNKFVHVSYQKMVPLPGTPFYRELKENGKVKDDWNTYFTLDMTHNYTDIPDKEFKEIFLFALDYFLRRDHVENIINYLSYKGHGISRDFIKQCTRHIMSLLFNLMLVCRASRRLKKTLQKYEAKYGA